jgi:regulator of ribosome biosynthesis
MSACSPRTTPPPWTPRSTRELSPSITRAHPRGNREAHLLALSLTSTQALLGGLFTLQTQSTEQGPVVKLPDAEFKLPREKPLPKPKPLTKWERFAKAKGISHSKKDKKVWDDEKQEWVNRWGRDGKNREGEDQWLHEYKANDDTSVDPRHKARAERKARVAKNERQHAANVAIAAANPTSTLGRETGPSAASTKEGRASARSVRKAELERSMLVSKTATASLGRFDKKIEGEPRAKGIKRKFEATVGDFKGEKEAAMSILNKVGTAERKKGPKKGGEGEDGGLNQRKAVRFEERKQQLANKRSKGRK